MESQIDMLNKALQRDETVADNTENVSVPQPDLRCEPDMDSENTPVFSMSQEQSWQIQPPAEKRELEKRDLEKTFGRFWMGVIASGKLTKNWIGILCFVISRIYSVKNKFFTRKICACAQIRGHWQEWRINMIDEELR